MLGDWGALQDSNNLQGVAEFLGSSVSQLRYILYAIGESDRYSTFSLPKRSGGERIIAAPRGDLKSLQRRLADILQDRYQPRHATHGFVRGRSIVTNARQHRRKRFVFNIDLVDFFPSINFGRVRGIFLGERFRLPEQSATILAQICCYMGSLPQGAPTSPVLSNMVCSTLDGQLMRLARDNNCLFTRYSDDITFSKRRGVFPPEIGYWTDNKSARVGNELRDVVESNGFEINGEKVRLFENSYRQVVTGLVVNDKTNVKRTYVRQIRAMLHAWRKFGEDAANAEYLNRYRHIVEPGVSDPSLRSVVVGKLAFLKMVKGASDQTYKNLQSQFVELCPEYVSTMQRENDASERRDVFISHASADKDAIARPLAQELLRRGVTVWFDEFELRIGDSLRQRIDEGLATSDFGVVVLSPEFFHPERTWTRRELDGLTAREDADGRQLILPIWHEITKEEVAKFSPTLAGILAAQSGVRTIAEMASDLIQTMRR